MSLEFLTPDARAPGQVIARSPMERAAARAGASLSRLDGWNVAMAHCEPALEMSRLTETVGFADRSRLAKLELQAEPELLARVVAQASGGLALEPGQAARSEDCWWCPVTPRRVLALSEPAHAAPLSAAVARAGAEGGGELTVLDLTCALAGMSLHGPQAREVLARFCALDCRPAVAPTGAFRPGSIARTPGYLLVEAPEVLLLLVGWALGEYLWDVVADAAEHLGGGPVGAEALTRRMEAVDA